MEKLKFFSEHSLSKTEMKNIKGGVAAVQCGYLVTVWRIMPDPMGPGGYSVVGYDEWRQAPFDENGISKQNAIDSAMMNEGRWCCDSCPWNNIPMV